MKVYVVTGLQLGWDCVVAVYSHEHVTFEELDRQYPADEYVVTMHEVFYQVESEV